MVALALPARQPSLALASLTRCGAAAHTPLHSPRAGAVRPPACAPPLPPLASSHSSRLVRIAAAHTVVVRVGSEWPQNIVRAAHQQLAQHHVPGLADS